MNDEQISEALKMQQVCALGLDHSRLLLINNSVKGDEMNSENKMQFSAIMTHSGNSGTSKNKETYRETSGQRSLCGDIGIAIDSVTREEIRRLRKKYYRDIYPDMDLDNDQLDLSAITLYTRNLKGEVNSTARLTVDGPVGFPQEQCLKQYRNEGKHLMELGRFVIADSGLNLLKTYYQAFYSIARNLQIDSIVMSMKPKDIAFHQRLLNVNVISRDTGITYGGPISLACVVWDLARTSDKFFDWLGGGNEY